MWVISCQYVEVIMMHKTSYECSTGEYLQSSLKVGHVNVSLSTALLTKLNLEAKCWTSQTYRKTTTLNCGY